jgi:hypothetical protein
MNDHIHTLISLRYSPATQVARRETINVFWRNMIAFSKDCKSWIVSGVLPLMRQRVVPVTVVCAVYGTFDRDVLFRLFSFRIGRSHEEMVSFIQELFAIVFLILHRHFQDEQSNNDEQAKGSETVCNTMKQHFAGNQRWQP